jgi:hypothetical protein
MGRKSEALRYAESCRGPWTNDNDVNRLCEEILLSSGLVDEAYRRYGLVSNRAGTYLGTFRAVARKYTMRHWPSPGPLHVIRGTLARAARDLAVERPDFAIEAGVVALEALVQGDGYEVTSADDWLAYPAPSGPLRREGIRPRSAIAYGRFIAMEASCGFVTRILGRDLGL